MSHGEKGKTKMIRQFRVKSGDIDSSGDATGFSPVVSGNILSVEVNYPTNTCEVDIDSQEGVSQKILNLATANTDIVVYPRVALEDNTGTALDLSDTEGGNVAVYGKFVVNGRLKLTIASGTEGESVTVFINVDDGK